MARGSPCLVPSADIVLVLHRHCNEKTRRLSIGVYHVGSQGRTDVINNNNNNNNDNNNNILTG